MKKLFFILLLVIPFSGKAQSPGYQGRHFILSYSPEVGLTNYLAPFGLSITTIPGESVNFILRHNIQAEYVVSRSMSIAAEYDFFSHAPVIYGSNGYDPGYIMNLSSGAFAFDFIFYSGQNNPIAPVGNYFKLKFQLSSYTANATEYNGNPLPSEIQSHSADTGQVLGIGIGFGHNHIVGNRVLITFGVNLEANLFFLNGEDITSSIPFKAVTHADMLGSFILPTLKIGVGGLLF